MDGNIEGLYFYLMTVLGLGFVISLSKFISLSKKISGLFMLVGQSSLFILALHIICFRIIDIIVAIFKSSNVIRKGSVVDYPFWWILYAIISIAVIVLIRNICNCASNKWRK